LEEAAAHPWGPVALARQVAINGIAIEPCLVGADGEAVAPRLVVIVRHQPLHCLLPSSSLLNKATRKTPLAASRADGTGCRGARLETTDHQRRAGPDGRDDSAARGADYGRTRHRAPRGSGDVRPLRPAPRRRGSAAPLGAHPSAGRLSQSSRAP